MSDVWEFREQVPHDGQTWGKWRFDERSRWLVYEDDEASLCIDLTAIDGSARMLDWIFWMNDHDWYTREDLADLIEAFDDIFYPQANLCPAARTSTWTRRNIFTYCREWASRSTSRWRPERLAA